ncbi:MAG TPA: divalent-cation tolerance protein CutA [Burkholderiales bacterium]|jgi:periplasmic divalent cation tolerance protein|nr:divalent-cation tolerance protein CutA [Burkholderiales bacterium]
MAPAPGATTAPATGVIVVLTNLPDRAAAMRLADALVERRLAACVSILAGCESVYRWKGAVERASEVPVLIKSTADAWPALEQAILKLHPYELPEILGLPVATGLEAYLGWVAAEAPPRNAP